MFRRASPGKQPSFIFFVHKFYCIVLKRKSTVYVLLLEFIKKRALPSTLPLHLALTRNVACEVTKNFEQRNLAKSEEV